MEKKQYQKPVLEKVNLRVTESVLTACKTDVKIVQPGGLGVSHVCNLVALAGICQTSVGS